MNSTLEAFVLQTMSASALQELEVIQTLWSGYGKIVRVALQGCEVQTLVLKSIELPAHASHPRGWNTSRSHARKVRSYEVEQTWYASRSHRCHSSCRVPRCYGSMSKGSEQLILLEDLDAAGFSLRKSDLALHEVELCLQWLAHFHATFLNEPTEGLWEIGTYWHLETRPDEWDVMEDGALKQAAGKIDSMLNACTFQTLVHGDAKVANFCFSKDNSQVAAVDFQYVGGGCGMKDVAYLLGSCLDESLCERWEEQLLTFYFATLHQALRTLGKSVDFDALEAEWRALFPVAWTDFYRFLLGWMPNHWKVNDYSERLASEVLKKLDSAIEERQGEPE